MSLYLKYVTPASGVLLAVSGLIRRDTQLSGRTALQYERLGLSFRSVDSSLEEGERFFGASKLIYLRYSDHHMQNCSSMALMHRPALPGYLGDNPRKQQEQVRSNVRSARIGPARRQRHRLELRIEMRDSRSDIDVMKPPCGDLG